MKGWYYDRLRDDGSSVNAEGIDIFDFADRMILDACAVVDGLANQKPETIPANPHILEVVRSHTYQVCSLLQYMKHHALQKYRAETGDLTDPSTDR